LSVIRRGTEADAAIAAHVLAQAFAGDPVWGWAYPMAASEPERVAPVWALWVRGAIANDSLWVTEGCEAVSVWVPPGAQELTEADTPRFEALTESLSGARAPHVLAAMEQFEAAHPSAPEHHYLSLLGTANAHRGRGIGMALMSAVLARIDAEGTGAYLESTNPAANDARYEGVGFERHGSFTVEAAAATVHTMWRAPAEPVAEAVQSRGI
jgi:ribosomal protein S18 acetylase RimI-like enzyme